MPRLNPILFAEVHFFSVATDNVLKNLENVADHSVLSCRSKFVYNNREFESFELMTSSGMN
jgi:hypothetical protein